MEEKQRFLSRILRSYRSLPDKKKYVEFFTAILTVPVLLTVIILNLSSLKKEEQPNPTPQVEQPKIVITLPEQPSTKTIPSDGRQNPTATPQQACKKEIGPIEISTPEEGDVVTDNPISIIVTQKEEGFCAVVWSYRINNGSWSDYDDKSIALYNPPKGPIVLELRIKSVVTGDEERITRKFTYDGTDTSATPSGTITN
ncbi:MAG: hypothetical protein Q8Q49_03415 [bacterium]|nr:hypothetical protein [bacterium]